MNDERVADGGEADRATLGDEARLQDVYSREAPRLSRFFRRHLGAIDDVADLVQESFLRFLRVASASSIDHPSAYLHRIARNLVFDRARTIGRRGSLSHGIDIDQVELPVPPDQSYQIEADELMEAYELALAELSPRTREVFILHRAEGLSYKQIAGQLGIGVRTVEWHIAEALVRIRRSLDQ